MALAGSGRSLEPGAAPLRAVAIIGQGQFIYYELYFALILLGPGGTLRVEECP